MFQVKKLGSILIDQYYKYTSTDKCWKQETTLIADECHEEHFYTSMKEDSGDEIYLCARSSGHVTLHPVMLNLDATFPCMCDQRVNQVTLHPP